MLVASAQIPVLAADGNDGGLSYADLTTLSDCEKKFFGGPHSSLPSAQRVDALENQVFGETKKGNLSGRIASLRSTLNANAPSLLAPPLTAKMDTSQEQAPPVSSSKPSPSAGQSDNQDLPPVAPPIDHAKNALHQALTLYQQGKLNDAEIAFKRVLAIDHDNTDANFNLGAIAEGRGDLPGALRYYKAVLKVNPDDPDAQQGVNAVQQKLASANTGPAQSAPDRLPPPATPNRDLLRQNVSQASAAFKRGDYDGSIRILQAVAQEAPNEPDVQYALAQSYKGKGEYMAARTALNQAIALAPDNQMYKDALRDLNRTIADGGAYNASNSSGNLSSNQDLGNNSAPAGQITPFTGVGSSSVGWQGTGDQYSSGQYHPAYANRYAGRSTTSRIERAAIGGLAGAAVGALFGGAFSGYGSRGRGMMMGAGMGGLFGAMFGAR